MTKKISSLSYFALALLIALLPASGSTLCPCKQNQIDNHLKKNNIPPRIQWNENFGYCGETSLISAGLYYGQYISQYEARAIASKNKPQNKEGSQLLLGVNDAKAASLMHLNAIEWDTAAEKSTDQFLAWVKQNVVKGYPVAIGVYTNEYLFYQNTKPNAGDPDYDHIVPVFGVDSNRLITDPNYYAFDTIYFSDNGLWGDPSNPPFIFSYPFGSFQASRKQANAKNGPVYSLANDGSNYGIAITGVKDLNGDTLPVRVDTNFNAELPSIKNGTSKRPAPMLLELAITISKLEPFVEYHLYRYNNLKDVPDSDFNAHGDQAYAKWKILIDSGSTFAMTDNIMSNEVAVYRAVRADAP